MHLVTAPLPGSYVVFPPVYAGPYPGAADEREARHRLRRVTGEGCDFFLDLTEDGELEPYAQLLPRHVRHVRLPLRKGEVPPPERMREVVDAINAVVPGANIALPEGRNPERPPDNYLDTTRLRADTGFRPEYDVQRAVPDYVNWLKGHVR
jgi:hypothetical protein